MKMVISNSRFFRINLLSILILFYSIFIFAQPFQTTIGYSYPTYEDGVSGLITNTGDILILGTNFNHPSGLFNQNGDMQLTWLSSSGNIINPSMILGQDVIESGVWIEKATDCNSNPGYIIAANQSGSGTNTMLLTLTNLTGVPQWVRRIGLATDDIQSVCVKQDNAGNFILIGTKTYANLGISTIYGVKINCSGTLIWEREYYVGLTAFASSVTAFATTPAPCMGLPNNYYITGKTVPPPAGNFAVFVLSIDANTGSSSFLKYYDLAPLTDDIANCIQGYCPSNIVPLGQLYISGYSVDPTDMTNPKKVMMMSTDLSGSLLWANSYDVQNSYREFSTHFQFDANKKIILTGKAEETGISDPPETGQCLLMRMDMNGSLVDWTRIFEMGFSSHGNRVEVTKKNEYFITGHSFTIPAIRQSNYDLLAIKTDPFGQTNASCYHSVATIINNFQPTVNSAIPSVITKQSLATTSLLNKTYQDKQIFCPFNPCDSLKLKAAFNFSVNGNMAFFTDLSSITSGHSISSWHWDFGDSNTSNSENASHTYSNPGFYIVCLTISASINGIVCRDSICQNVEIKGPNNRCDNIMLASNFNFTGNGNTISFIDLSSIHSGYSFFSWNWDFGDGNASTNQNPLHTYANQGNYIVCLIVSGGNGSVICNDTICKKINVPYEPADNCKSNIVKNGQFDQGALIGDLGAPGTSAYWSRWTWSPQVINFDFCKDSFAMQMWGNQVVGEGILQSVNFQKNGIYQLSFCAKRLNTTYPNAQARFRAFVSPVTYLDYYNCLAGACDEIFISPVLSGSWVNYISAPWTATQNYDLLTVSVWNNYNTLDKAYTSWLRIDDICIERIGTVGTNKNLSKLTAKLFPNPANDNVTVEFNYPVPSQATIQILDIVGHLISSSVFLKGETRSTVLMNQLHSGIYFVRVLDNKKVFWNGKLVKEK